MVADYKDSAVPKGTVDRSFHKPTVKTVDYFQGSRAWGNSGDTQGAGWKRPTESTPINPMHILPT